MIQLRDYQQKIKSEIRQSYISGKSCPLVQLHTGGGKSIILGDIIGDVTKNGRTSIVIAHRKSLIMQLSLTLAEFGIMHRIFAPPSIVRKIKIAHLKSKKIRRCFVDHAAQAAVGSSQAVAGMIKNKKMGNFLPSFAVMDEAHHVVRGNTWGNIFDAWPKAKKLMLTATPERTDGKGLGVHAHGYVDDLIIGPPMSKLIEIGSLAKYVVYGPVGDGFDTSHVPHNGREFDESALNSAAVDRSLTGDAIEHYKSVALGLPAVAFLVSIERSTEFCTELNAAGISAVHVDSKMDDDEITAAFCDFAAGKYQVICNQDIISEGFDLQAITQTDVTIDCVIDLAPTMSIIKFRQKWGRALRPNPLTPVKIILDHANNWQRHGLPHHEHPWSLDGAEKKKKNSKKEDEEDGGDIKVRKCPQCHAIHEPSPYCPSCSYEYPIKSRGVSEVEGQLQVIDEELAAKFMAAKRRQQQGQASEVSDLLALGYSKSRAEKIIEAREEKRRLIYACKELANEHTRATGVSAFKAFGVHLGAIDKLKPAQLKALIKKITGN